MVITQVLLGYDFIILARTVASVAASSALVASLDNTAQRLEAAGLAARAELIFDGHQNMAAHVPCGVRAVMFNLGWLPGAQHIVTTKTSTTLEAVRAAAELLMPGGVMTICVYPGHEEGRCELSALLDDMAETMYDAQGVGLAAAA